MHLQPCPQHFVKDGEKPRLAFYTVEARELRADGWTRAEELEIPEVDPVEKETEEAIEPEIEELNPFDAEPIPGDINFESMTKRELLQYAKDHGLDLPDSALKAELVEACEAI